MGVSYEWILVWNQTPYVSVRPDSSKNRAPSNINPYNVAMPGVLHHDQPWRCSLVPLGKLSKFIAPPGYMVYSFLRPCFVECRCDACNVVFHRAGKVNIPHVHRKWRDHRHGRCDCRRAPHLAPPDFRSDHRDPATCSVNEIRRLFGLCYHEGHATLQVEFVM